MEKIASVKGTMKEENTFTYTPLAQPQAIPLQDWPADITPLVGVKVITYNHEQFIADCLEGILKQRTTFPVKIYIHDDASTDQTKAILGTYEQKYPTLVQVYYQPENTYYSKNKREKRAPFDNLIQGKYIALCEGDDYWTDPLKLQKQVDFLERNPDFSFSFHFVDKLTDSGITPEVIPDAPEIIDVRDVILMKSEVARIIIRTCSVLHRTQFQHFPDWVRGSSNLDYALFLHLAASGKGYCIKQVMSVYRIHPQGAYSGIMLNKDLRQLALVYLNNIQMLTKFNKHLKYQHNAETNRSILNRHYLFLTTNRSPLTHFKFFLSRLINFDFRNMANEFKLNYSLGIRIILHLLGKDGLKK